MAALSVHVFITGRVQGVGYRAFVKRKAGELSLSGWVRNRASGEVEAVFCGAEANVEAMVSACRTGPHGARVDGVRVAPGPDPLAGPFEVADTI